MSHQPKKAHRVCVYLSLSKQDNVYGPINLKQVQKNDQSTLRSSGPYGNSSNLDQEDAAS